MKLMIFALTILLATTGCASKQDLEASQVELAECQEEQTRLEASVISWEQRFDRAAGRWNELEASVADALPKALGELHTERERIIKLVPEQVQSEVAAYLEEYFATVMKGFNKLSHDNADIKLQLQVTHKALEAVGADTRAIGVTIEETVAEERSQRVADQARRQEVLAKMAGLVDQVVEFDQNRINCKECPDRLKLNRKQRESILGFHAELVAELATLQTLTGSRVDEQLAPETEEFEAE